MRKIFNKFNLILNLWISLIINISLSIVLPIVAMGTVNLPVFLRGFAIAFPVSTVLVLLLPLNQLGDFIAAKLGFQPQTIPFTFASTAVLSFTLGTFMSMLMTYINAGAFTGLFTPAYFAAWFSCVGLGTAFRIYLCPDRSLHWIAADHETMRGTKTAVIY